MAESRPTTSSDGGFWVEKPCSANNVGGVSIWLDKKDWPCFKGKLRMGDRLEFKDRDPQEHWSIYVGGWGSSIEHLVHFAPAPVRQRKDGTEQLVYFASAPVRQREDDTEQFVHFASAPGGGVGSSLRPTPELCPVMTALRGDQVRINNERDQSTPPSSPKQIEDEIKHLLPDSNGRLTRNIVFRDSEDFVNYCRYDNLRINFGVVSDWYRTSDLLPRLRPGDRLEFKRHAFKHWAIYVGDWEEEPNQVVHFTLPEGKGEKSSKKKSSHSKSSFMMEVAPIGEVMKKGRVRTNNERDEICPPVLGSLVLSEIKRNLESQSDGYRRAYGPVSSNCEHFVNHCRYNETCSDQVITLKLRKMLGKCRCGNAAYD